MEKYFYKKKLLGVRMRGFKRGTVSITGKNESTQALAIFKTAGTGVTPHRHRQIKRVTKSLQECIVVIEGKIRVNLFGETKKKVKSVILRPGDLFITLYGGHAINFLEDSKIYEIKNGPFVEDREEID